MHTALLKGSKVGSNAILDGSLFHFTIARGGGGRTSTYNSPLLYGSGDKLKGESSYVKSWLNAQHTVLDLKLLIHG